MKNKMVSECQNFRNTYIMINMEHISIPYKGAGASKLTALRDIVLPRLISLNINCFLI